MRLSLLGLCALLLLGTAAPATAATFVSKPYTSISFTGPKVKGYDLSGGGRTGQVKGFSYFLSKDAKGVSQSHSTNFDKRGTVKVAKDLSSGKLAYKLGAGGSVSLRFRATKAKRTQALTKGCKGARTQTREGVLRGKLKLVVDKKFFRTIKLKELKGAVAVAGKQTCTTSGGGETPKPQPALFSFDGSGASLSVTRAGKRVRQSVSTSSKGPGGSQRFHNVSADRLPASAFTIAPDGRTATVTGGGPFKGSGRFTASSLYNDGASGRLAGDLSVKIDSVGTLKLLGGASGVQASLTNPGFRPPNQSPVAGFSFGEGSQNREVVFFNESSDPDGSVASVSWNFGDGTTSTENNPTHVYAAPGNYTVTLTVTDDRGASDTETKSVQVADPPNIAPVAGFSYEQELDSRVVNFFDESSDSDGSIVSYAWSFGDGTTSTATNPTHAYATSGNFTVTLSVTDDRGTTDSATQFVSVVDP